MAIQNCNSPITSPCDGEAIDNYLANRQPKGLLKMNSERGQVTPLLKETRRLDITKPNGHNNHV